jgi:hypothetical protein
MRQSGKIGCACAAAITSLFAPVIATSAVRAAPFIQTLPDASGVSVEKVGCGWVNGWNGPAWVCQPDYGHHDYHPGHWDAHGDHYDYHPGHWDYHHGGHVDHED